MRELCLRLLRRLLGLTLLQRLARTETPSKFECAIAEVPRWTDPIESGQLHGLTRLGEFS